MLKTLVTAMMPILEIRGAIPVGVASGLDPWLAFAVGFVGNMLPIPILILLTRKIIEWLKKHNMLVKLTAWLENKGSKGAQKVQKYSFWGLFILVAIPLPGTGAWTGALVASLLDMRLKRALPAIAMGVAVAGLIVLLVTYGVISAGSLI
ncbi:MAG: small multi-drug export protein [Firmicutes bacterium]|nr:small multi-drug export protein [Bacillota bacterium]CCX72062.1 putative small multi-drug export protein [Firmicutes bacterium CAG:555]